MDPRDLLRKALEALDAVGIEYILVGPEDVIIKKMEYYREGGSEKYLRDIRGILSVSGEGLDVSYVERWAARKGLTEIWRAILSKPGG
jgi:glutamine synthetase